MMHLLRPYQVPALVALAALGAAAALAPQPARAQANGIVKIMDEPTPLMSATTARGYLGVLVGDVDADTAAKLKLKEVRGAIVTLIDHDAPAGQIGLKINDVITQLNGQQIEGAEQLRRMLHEIPPGRKVTLVISRDGIDQTLNTEMGDHKKIVEGFWSHLGNGDDVLPANGPGMNLLTGDATTGTALRFSVFGSTLKVGAMVEPLTSQMAEYLGVSSGLMVKQVAHKTEAATAGLKAFDVILKVGTDNIATIADWERALHANQGKPVQVTILRDKKQQTLTLQVDSKHVKGELEMEDLFGPDECPLVAALGEQPVQIFAFDSKQADEMRKQAEQLRDQLKNGIGEFKIDPKQAEEMRKQAEQLRDSMKGFQFDQKKLDELKNQMDDWKKNFNTDQFKIDQKQLDELKKQMNEMDQWKQDIKPEMLELDPQWI